MNHSVNPSIRKLVKVISLAGLGLLCACNNVNADQTAANDSAATIPNDLPETCPSPAAALPTETTQKEIEGRTYAFSRFDYGPREIVLQENIVRFLAREYDFVHCLEDGTWTVQPGTLGDEWIAVRSGQLINRPDFSSLDANGETYQYRVVRSPHPQTNGLHESVVLELLLPGEDTPQQHTLYTLEDLQQASGSPEIGPAANLGIPYVTTAVAYGDRLWWTVAFEQGEGNNGIATIVSYDLATEAVTLIQPNELWSQQILNLAFTGEPQQPTLWMGTRRSSEGIRDVPAMGLVSYKPSSVDDLTSGKVDAYNPYNSPLIGAIPTQLAVDGEQLWIGTRNGVCGLAWQAPEAAESWNCWQFTTKAIVSPIAQAMQSVPVYPSRLSQTPVASLPVPPSGGDMAEILWWMLADGESQQGRYEVRLEQSFEVSVGQGASPTMEPQWVEIPGRVPMFWPGYWWYWQGDRFVRPLDHGLDDWVAGDRGIGP